MGAAIGQGLQNRSLRATPGNEFDALLRGIQPFLTNPKKQRAALIFFHQFVQRQPAVFQYVNDFFKLAHRLLKSHFGVWGTGGTRSGHGNRGGIALRGSKHPRRALKRKPKFPQ